jgi:hypothetical protein
MLLDLDRKSFFAEISPSDPKSDAWRIGVDQQVKLPHGPTANV